MKNALLHKHMYTTLRSGHHFCDPSARAPTVLKEAIVHHLTPHVTVLCEAFHPASGCSHPLDLNITYDTSTYAWISHQRYSGHLDYFELADAIFSTGTTIKALSEPWNGATQLTEIITQCNHKYHTQHIQSIRTLLMASHPRCIASPIHHILRAHSMSHLLPIIFSFMYTYIITNNTS